MHVYIYIYIRMYVYTYVCIYIYIYHADRPIILGCRGLAGECFTWFAVAACGRLKEVPLHELTACLISAT